MGMGLLAERGGGEGGGAGVEVIGGETGGRGGGGRGPLPQHTDYTYQRLAKQPLSTSTLE